MCCLLGLASFIKLDLLTCYPCAVSLVASLLRGTLTAALILKQPS